VVGDRLSIWWQGGIQVANLKRYLSDLTDSNPDVRQRAAYNLSLLDDQRVVEPLCRALDDPEWYVRSYVVSALGIIGDRRAVGPLAYALQDTDSGVRFAAVMALANMGEPAVEPLIRALGDEEYTVRKEAAESLGKIGDQRALDPLNYALNDPDWPVHRAAVLALEALGKPTDESSSFRTDQRVGGLIAYYGLTDWWFSFFNEEERAYIEQTYRPFTASVGGEPEGCMLTTGNIAYASGSRTRELSYLGSWFHAQENRPIADRIYQYTEETMGSLCDIAIEEGQTALRTNDRGTSIIDAHFLYLHMIQTHYKDRDKIPDALEKAIQACEKQIAIAPQAARAFRAEYAGEAIPEHTGYKQLTIIRDKQGDYAEAIRLCEEAKAQGWAGDWDKRIARYSKKAGTQTETKG